MDSHEPTPLPPPPASPAMYAKPRTMIVPTPKRRLHEQWWVKLAAILFPPLIAGWFSLRQAKIEAAEKLGAAHAKSEAGYAVTAEELNRGNAERAALLDRVARLEGEVQILANQIDAHAVAASRRQLPPAPISGAYEAIIAVDHVKQEPKTMRLLPVDLDHAAQAMRGR